MSTIKKTTEEKKSAKAAYDKTHRAAKTTGKTPSTKAEVAADRAAVIAERAALKATAGTHGRPMVKAQPDLSKATQVDQKLLDKVVKTPAGKALVKAQKEAREPAVRQPTVASVAKEMVMAGETDGATFAALVKRFSVGNEKKYYPSWYRSQLVRKGTVTKAFADEHRHNKTA